MIFIFLFVGIALSLFATDGGNRAAAFAGMLCAVLALLVGLVTGQVGLPLFLAGALVLGIVPVMLQLQKMRNLNFAVVENAWFRETQFALSLLGTIVALLLGLRVFGTTPTFPVLADEVISSRFPTPLTIHGSFAKGFAGLALLLIVGALAGFERKRGKARYWWQVPFLAAFAVLIAMLLFRLPLDPKFPESWWRFVLSNLLLTCVAEEALFRGVLYKYATDAFDAFLPRFSLVATLMLTSLLFAAVHTGSMEYLFMVFVVGLVSGWARHITGTVSAAVVTHGAVNCVHFFALKYPF